MRKLTQSMFIGVFALLFFVSNATAQSKVSDKKVLFVVTSHSQMGDTGEATGFWLEEFATPYYYLLDKGVEITIASPKGGQPPVDPRSTAESAATKSTKRFQNDVKAKRKMKNTLKLEQVNPAEFDAVFYPGGHGPLWDLAEDENSIELIETFYRQDKPVAFVCHAPGVLKNVENTDGTPLVKGKKVAGFTNSEEKAVGLTDVVPFLVEDMLKENGGIYSKGADWGAYAVSDGLLITGQNPASSELVAEKLIILLNEKKEGQVKR